MNAPTQPQPKTPTRPNKPHRAQHRHQPYKRTSAIIDERPDGKPIIFGYGRHMTKKEKERAQRRIAYTALGFLIVVSVVIIAVAAVWDNIIYPNQSVASINGQGISRHDVDLLTGYYTAEASASNGQITGDPATLATQKLQRDTLTRMEAKQKLGITVSNSDAAARLQAQITSLGGEGAFRQILSATGLSQDDYRRLVTAPILLNERVGIYLTRHNPTTAPMWHYARMLLKDQKTAQSVLQELLVGGKGKDFATLANKLSLDQATNTKGGDPGWVRTTDGTIDPLLVTFLPTLESMRKTNTKYKLFMSGTSPYIVEYLGYDPKHPLSATQRTNDQANAFDAWFTPLQAAAIANPPLTTSGSTTSLPNGASVPVAPAPKAPSTKK